MRSFRTCLLFLFLCLAAQVRAVEPGEPALPWSLLSAEGMEIDYPRIAEGKSSLLVFVGSGCPDCAPLIEALQALRDDFSSHEVEVYVVGGGDLAALESVVGPGHDFVLLPEGAAVISEYAIEGVPALLLVDQRGFVNALEVAGAGHEWGAAIRPALETLVAPE